MKKQEGQLIKFLGGLAGGYIGGYFLLNLVKNQNIKPDFKALGLVGLGIALPILVKDKKLMPIVSGVGVGLGLKGAQDYVNILAMRDLQKQQIQNQTTATNVGFLPEPQPTLQGDELPEQLDQQDIFYTDENENLYIVIKAPNTTTLIDATTGDVVAVNTANAKHFELNEDTKEVKFLNQQTLQGEQDDEEIKSLFEDEITDDVYSY